MPRAKYAWAALNVQRFIDILRHVANKPKKIVICQIPINIASLEITLYA